MTIALLLDTCAALWMTDGLLTSQAIDCIDSAAVSGGVGVSAITAWEVSLLMSKGRIALPAPARIWFARLIGVNAARLIDLSPDILIAANELPGHLHRDPADRILAATARHFHCPLMTRDKALLDFAAAGHLQAIPC